MKLLDSNILIYSALDEYNYLRPLIFDKESYVSKITQLEVLGFHRLNEDSKQYFISCFSVLKSFDINSLIIEKAILLRQQRKMSLGDAIVTATALFYGATLVTRNIQDFEKIENLNVINPIPCQLTF
jgi:predicted nucleic acid-binding protein